MATIRPFRGCRYDPAAVGNLSSVICPPYDMIGPQLKTELQQRSPYNAVHLEGGEQPDPVDPQAGYQQAAGLFQRWLSDGVLRRDDAGLVLPDEARLQLRRTPLPAPGVVRRRPGRGLRRRRRCCLTNSPANRPCWTAWPCWTPARPSSAPSCPCTVTLKASSSAYSTQSSPNRRTHRPPPPPGAPPSSGASATRQRSRTSSKSLPAAPSSLPTATIATRRRCGYRRSRPDGQQSDDAAASNYVMMTLVEFDDPGLSCCPTTAWPAACQPSSLKPCVPGWASISTRGP